MKHLALLLIIYLPLQASAGAFMFGSAPNAAPAPAPVAAKAPAQTETPKAIGTSQLISPSPIRKTTPDVAATLKPAEATVSKEDKQAEGRYCPTCGPTTAPKTGLQKIDPSHIAGATPKAVETRASNSNGNECLRKLILASAKNVVKNIYGNAPTSGGWCAKGVGRSLMKAGYQYPSAEAIGYHTGGRMKQMGFENIMRKGLDAENAPPGAILVFRGPLTKMSRANGGLPQGKTRMQSRRLRGGRGAGTWVGHVTIKSDKPDEYLTDALTEDPAVANRTLVAIYVPVTCTGVTCKGAAARACVE